MLPHALVFVGHRTRTPEIGDDMRELGGIDTMFVSAETPSMPLHVIGVLVMEPSVHDTDAARQRIRDTIAERIPLLPPFRWRLVEAPGGLGTARWIEDPDFDLDAHVHMVTLPEPGTMAQLEDHVGRFASTPLERDRPLWEIHLVDGLDDGRIAMVSKLHHSFMDGGAGAEVTASLLDLTADADPPAPVDDRQPERPPSPWTLLASVPASAISRTLKLPGLLRRTVSGMSGLVGAMFPLADGGLGGYIAPRTPYNGALTPERIVSLTSHPLDDVRRIKTAFGVTVNDVVLAVVAGSIRSDLEALDAVGDRPLIAAVPISVRAAKEPGTAPESADYTNHTSAMMVPLPTNIDDPVARLERVHEVTVQLKEHHDEMGSELLDDWAAMFPPWVASLGARLVDRFDLDASAPPIFNVIVSNVQGSPIPLFLGGAEAVALYPFGPLVGGCGLNITVLSHLDTLHIGLIADPSMVEHPHELTAGVRDGIDELAALVD